MRDSEVVNKVKETGGIRMIICEIFCLFEFITCPLFLILFELWSQLQINYPVTSFGVALRKITTDLESGYWKVKSSEASWNKFNFGG